MEQYKALNAQLMDQVQSQRKMIGQMREEEVLLKRQWMEERERRLTEAQYNEMKLKYAIQTLLKNLDINVDLTGSASSPHSTQALENGRNSRSNSNRICTEFRRSSVHLQRSVPVSPVSRRSSIAESLKETISYTSHEEETTAKTPEPRHLGELREHTNSPVSPATAEATEEEAVEGVDEEEEGDPTLMSPPGIACGLIYSIIEESDNEISASTSSSSSSVSESTEPQQLRVFGGDTKKASPLPLRDVTNKSNRQTASPKNTKARGNLTIFTQSDAENDIQEATVELGRSTRPAQTRPSRQVRRRGKVTDNDSLEASIEHVRHATRQSSPMVLTVPSISVNMGPNLTPRRSQLNFERFNGIINRPGDCSTPRGDAQETEAINETVIQCKRSRAKAKERESSEQSMLESTLSSRPSRSCRPKSLKEPSSRTKLRNESSIK